MEIKCRLLIVAIVLETLLLHYLLHYLKDITLTVIIPINDNINVESVLMQKSMYSGTPFLRIQGIEYTNSK